MIGKDPNQLNPNGEDVVPIRINNLGNVNESRWPKSRTSTSAPGRANKCNDDNKPMCIMSDAINVSSGQLMLDDDNVKPN